MLRYAFSMEHFRHRLAHTEALPQMVLLGILCGFACGLLIGGFRLLLDLPLASLLPGGSSEGFEQLPSWLRFTLPIVGSLILIACLSRVTPINRQVGITHLMERMAYHQSKLPLVNIFVQFFSAIIALLFGHSVGKEGPAIHMGAGLGSQLGQRLELPNNTLRILAGCGTAAGIAAAFNTPLAGVVFAMEVILLEYTVIGFMPVMVAAVTGTLTIQFMFGNELALTVPMTEIQTLHEIPYVVFLGGIIGLLAVLFIALLTKTLKWSQQIQMGYGSKLLIAGLLTGTVAIYYPQVMGVGYDTIESALQGQFSLQLLVGILIAKCLLTPIVIGLGIPAGLIGPTFFVGAVAGGALGILGSSAVEHQVANSGFYALLGMGSMMAAVTNAPMAALVAILELTGNPSIIFPAMISIIIANLIARYVFNMPSIFVASMHAQGMDYRFKPLNLVLSRSAVGSLMNTNFIQTESIISFTTAEDILSKEPDWILINDHNKRQNILSPGDLHSQIQLKKAIDEPLNLMEIPALRLDTADISQNATLQEALEAMSHHEVEALSITNRHGNIRGLLTRIQIEEHYRQN